MLQDQKDDDSLVTTSTSAAHQGTHLNDDGKVVVASSTSNDDVGPPRPISSPSIAAASAIEKIPSLAGNKEESQQQEVDIVLSYDNSIISTTQEEDSTAKSIRSWQQLSHSMRSEILYEGKSPTWREDWFGVHLPPSAVARGAPPTIEEEEVLERLPNQDVEKDGTTEEVDQDEQLDSEAVITAEESPPPKQTVPIIVNTPPVIDALPSSTTPTTSSFSLSSLLTSPGPSIPLYPLLLLLTTLYILKQTLHLLFGYKSRTRVTRSMTRVLLNKKQFVIPKDQLLEHIEWMRLRNDLRRMREKNKKKMLGMRSGGGSLDENDEGGGHDGG
eukprot:scaffold4595_cov121-Skeletonema_menzelii.AAC.1